MKKAILLMLVLAVASVEGANNSISTLKVFPEDVLNPATNWQYIRIAAPKTASYDHLFKFYDDIGKSEIQQLINGRWVPVDFSLDKAYKAAPQADSSSLTSKHSILQEKDSVLYYRIRYSPYKETGKWDLVIEDQLGAKTTLDPYWHTAEQNVTYGYPWLTNHSFTDSFTSYGLGTANITDYWNNQSNAYWVNSTDNGFGFNDWALEDIQPAAAWHYINTSFTAENFELLFKLAIMQDLGTDYCDARIGTASSSMATFRTLDSVNANLDMGGNHFDADFLPPPSTIYVYQFIKNGTTCTFKYKGLGDADWQDTISDSCSGSMAWLRFGTYQAHCLFDDVVIRELTPAMLRQNYHASFIYGSSNATEWSNVTVEVYKDGVEQYNTSDDSPTDQEIPDYSYKITEAGTWYYKVAVTDALGYSAYNSTQSMVFYEPRLYICGAVDTPGLNITIYNEQTPSQQLTAAVEIDGTAWKLSDPSTEYTFNFSLSGASTYQLCMYDYPFQADIYIKYTVSGGFTHRYYLQNQTFNVLQNFSMYNWNTTTGASDLSITVRNANIYRYYEDILGKLQRRYVGEGVWRTVQMDRSGSFGQLFYNIREEDTDYRLIFMDGDNNVLSTTASMKFVCDSGVCVLEQELTPFSGDATESDVSVQAVYDNITKILTVTWSEPTGADTDIHVQVNKQTMMHTVMLCNSTSTAPAGTATCNLSGLTGTVYVYAQNSGTDEIAQWIDVDNTNLVSVLGTGDANILGFFVVATVFMMGLFSAGLAVIFAVIALAVIYLLGLSNVINFTLIMVGAVGSIVIGVAVRNK